MPNHPVIEVVVLGHQMFMQWCSRCLLNQPWCRVYLRIGADASTKRWCLVCGNEEAPADE